MPQFPHLWEDRLDSYVVLAGSVSLCLCDLSAEMAEIPELHSTPDAKNSDTDKYLCSGPQAQS